MSGQIKITTSLAASASNVNLLTGQKLEFLSAPAVVSVYQSQDVNTDSNVETTLTLGNTVIGEDLVPNFPAVALGGPKTNEDLLCQGVGAAGDRIQIRARETGGNNTAVFRTLVTISDL